MLLSIERVVELLASLEKGAPLPPELRDTHYVVLHGLDPEAMRDPPDEDGPFYEKAKDWIGLRLAGHAKDLGTALSLLWESIRLLQERFDDPRGGDMRWERALSDWISNGPFSTPDDEADCAANFGVGPAKRLFPKSRYVVAIFGDAPYEGENAAILELPPVTALGERERALLDACRAGDARRADELLRAGADPRVTDDHFNTPLHYAVAHRSRALVERLAEAGADLDAHAAFHHAPVFATFDDEGGVGPYLSAFDDEAHFELIRDLVLRGANPRATGALGATLLDVTTGAPPMDERRARFFLERGVSSRLMAFTTSTRTPLDSLLSSLHFDSPEKRARTPDQVRILGWLGCDPNDTTHDFSGETPVEKFLTTGYGADEVEPEVLIGIARALVEIGARDEPGRSDPRRPSDRAQNWSKYESMRHYAEVARVFREGRGA